MQVRAAGDSKKAERFLLAAERAFALDDWETCVSRAYYAVYHAVIHVLEVRGGLQRQRWDHDQLQADFRARFAARGLLFTQRDAVQFNRLRERRLRADYDVGSNRRHAIEGVQTAKSFLAQITEVTRDAQN